ncbi:hypothetical protein FQN60_015950 [Etheostoma spectabile]|uniref:Uncharacterized protein n=1 Tax=Etheostoma spectabile TaxID=54343 RepID=A0A5J5CPK9_9PERO|nr:hypothetical protein FQN60_015950 [Etheostoma spectabile]
MGVHLLDHEPGGQEKKGIRRLPDYQKHAPAMTPILALYSRRLHPVNQIYGVCNCELRDLAKAQTSSCKKKLWNLVVSLEARIQLFPSTCSGGANKSEQDGLKMAVVRLLDGKHLQLWATVCHTTWTEPLIDYVPL